MNTTRPNSCNWYHGFDFPLWLNTLSSEMCSDRRLWSENDAARRLSNVYSERTSFYTTASTNSNRTTTDDARPSTGSSISARAGSFDGVLEPDPERVLLLRFRALPMDLTLKIVDEVVRVAVDSLYTGCRACRWQEWSRCICRHWQKTFCTLASLENAIGAHTRRFGKKLARSWGYSSADAFGPYAAGFRFTGLVIGGLRMADFIFVDEKLTALPEPEYEEISALTRELDLGHVAFASQFEPQAQPKPQPRVKPQPASAYWSSDKGKEIAAFSFELDHAVSFGSILDSANLQLPSEKVLTAGKNLQQPKRASGPTFGHFRPSANTVFHMISATARKLRGHAPVSSASGGFSLIHAHGCGKAESPPMFGSTHSSKRQRRDANEVWDTPMNLGQ